MSKQINFFATEHDKHHIMSILNNVFEQLIEVSYHKSQFLLFNSKNSGQMFYLAENNRKNDIFYQIHEYYDGTTAELLDYRKSPILEYTLASKSLDGYYTRGRFYCCTDDKDFSKKVSKLFTMLKKEFWLAKKWQSYISKSIDVENSLFFVPNRTITISKQDLQ